MYRVRGRFEVTFRCFENVWHKGLRISINDREPGALYLDQDAMAFLERVVLCVQAEVVVEYCVRFDRFGFFKTLAVSSPKNFV